jgi:hypothetical protein
MYVLFSSDSDLDLLGRLISRAGFVSRLVAERSILIESMILYELRAECESNQTDEVFGIHTGGSGCAGTGS